MEIPAIALFVYSCLIVSGLFEPYSNTIDYMNALYQSPYPKWIETASLWQIFRYGIIAIVIILFFRLYSSFSIFDHDTNECIDWIHPLTGAGRLLETGVRLAVVGYLIFQIHHGITGEVHPLIIDATQWFQGISSEEDLRSVINYRIKGPVYQSSAQQSEVNFIGSAATEIRSLALNIAVLVELMIISLVWDLLLLTGRIRMRRGMAWAGGRVASACKSLFESGTAPGKQPSPRGPSPEAHDAKGILGTHGSPVTAPSAEVSDQRDEGPYTGDSPSLPALRSFAEIRGFPFKDWLPRFVLPHLFVAIFMIVLLFVISYLASGDDSPLVVGIVVIIISFIIQIVLSASIIISWLLFVGRKLLGYSRVSCPRSLNP